MKKRFLAALLAATMMLGLVACGSSKETAQNNAQVSEQTASEDSSTDTADAKTEIKTVTPGKLTVATSPDFAPYEFYAIVRATNARPASAPAYRVNIEPSESSPYYEICPVSVEGITTGITTITTDAKMGDNVYYNLLGQPVANPTSGIYILNGKKVIIR